jgi:diguanylate cyclase (GGDEF)-like protein
MYQFCHKASLKHQIQRLYGVEEFLVVLPKTDTKGRYILAHRLRHTISRMAIMDQGKGIRITASFGVTGFDPSLTREKISSEALINMTDRCLYQAKRDGRNRVKMEAF